MKTFITYIQGDPMKLEYSVTLLLVSGGSVGVKVNRIISLLLPHSALSEKFNSVENLAESFNLPDRATK